MLLLVLTIFLAISLGLGVTALLMIARTNDKQNRTASSSSTTPITAGNGLLLSSGGEMSVDSSVVQLVSSGGSGGTSTATSLTNLMGVVDVGDYAAQGSGMDINTYLSHKPFNSVVFTGGSGGLTYEVSAFNLALGRVGFLNLARSPVRLSVSGVFIDDSREVVSGFVMGGDSGTPSPIGYEIAVNGYLSLDVAFTPTTNQGTPGMVANYVSASSSGVTLQ